MCARDFFSRSDKGCTLVPSEKYACFFTCDVSFAVVKTMNDSSKGDDDKFLDYTTD